MADIRKIAAKFSADILAEAKKAADADPKLEQHFPGSYDALRETVEARVDTLMTEVENTIAGWTEAVAQAPASEPAPDA